jgi:hypothetical protein
MFNSTILDLALGLVFIFLALSLAVSATVEAIASIRNWRSRTLLQGMKDLLNDPEFTELARDMYNHALVNPRDGGNAVTEQDLKTPPAYIDPKGFAHALIDLTNLAGKSPPAMKSAIDSKIKNRQLNNLLNGIIDRTSGDLGRVRDELARWFDNGMDRVSGAYKRKTQAWSFVIALITIAILNVSAIDVGRALWQQPIISRTIAANPNQTLAQALKQLDELGNIGIPIGWTEANRVTFRSTRGIWTVVGWVVTAIATLFGAPFWFDALQRIVRLKGAGPSPSGKRPDSGGTG